MADSPLDALSGPAGTIGRYFSILSVIPSSLLVTFVLVLDGSHATSGTPDWSRGFSSIGDGGFTKIGQIALASLLIGLVLQPLQFSLVQLAEGYWGTSRLANSLMRRRIVRHQRARRELNRTVGESLAALESAGESPRNPDHEPVSVTNISYLLDYDEAKRALTSYPHSPNNVRPTRLGNVLRRYEAEVGAPYGLSLPVIAPHLGLIAPEAHVAYIDDQRTQLDLAVRLAVVNVIACVTAIGFLWRDGMWLAVAVVPYLLAYLFYRGSIIVAAEYCTALSTVLDLNRFTLYEKLRIKQPATRVQEEAQSQKLITLLRNDLHPDDRRDPLLSYAVAMKGGNDDHSTESTFGGALEVTADNSDT